MAIGKWFGNSGSQPASGTATDDVKALSISSPDCKRFGLENFGNTCYANSVLQALYFCHPFRELVVQSPDSSNPSTLQSVPPAPSSPPSQPPPPQRTKSNKKVPSVAETTQASGNTPTGPIIPPAPPTLFSALRSLYVHIANNSQEKGVVAPRAFVEKLKKENELFRSTMHQDAHEFLNYLLNKVAEDLSEEEKNLSSGSSREDLTKSTLTSTSSSSTRVSSRTTFVQDLFEGVLTSETRCLTCESLSSRDEAFLDLSIDIEQNSSVTACLRQFSASEMLCQKNKFFCDSCCGLQEAERRMKIKKLPNVLALHLKRFKYQEEVQKYIKLAYRVAFPLELRLFNTADDAKNPDRLYELFAIVVHIGNGPHHGHYVAIVKSTGSWLVFDDDSVETIKEGDIPKYFGDSVGSGSAYVLYYQAVDLNEEALGIRHPDAVATVESLPVTSSPTAATPVLPPGLSVEDGVTEIRVNGHMSDASPAPATLPAQVPPMPSPPAPIPVPVTMSSPLPIPPVPVSPPAQATIFPSKSASPPLSLAIPSLPTSPQPIQTPAAQNISMPGLAASGSTASSSATPRSGPSSFFNTLRHSTSVRAVSNAASSMANRQSLHSSSSIATTPTALSPPLSKTTSETPDMSEANESQAPSQAPVVGRRQVVKERSTGWFTKRRSLKMDSEQNSSSMSSVNVQGMASSAAEARALSSGKHFKRPSTSGAVNGHRKTPSAFEIGRNKDELREEDLQPPALNLRHEDSPASVASSLPSESTASVSFPSVQTTPEPHHPNHHHSHHHAHSMHHNSPALPPIPHSPMKSPDHKNSSSQLQQSPTRRKSERIPPRPATASGKLSSQPFSNDSFPVPPVPPIRNGVSMEKDRYAGSLDSHSSNPQIPSSPLPNSPTPTLPSSPPPSAANKRAPRKLSFTGGMLGFGRKDKDRHKDREPSVHSPSPIPTVSVGR